MKNVAILAAVVCVCFASVGRADLEPGELFHFANESELGYVLVAGNAQSETFNVRQENAATWSGNKLVSTFKFLRSATTGVTTARSLSYSLRQERRLFERFSLFVGGGVESNRFSGIDPRWTVDFGVQYKLVATEATSVAVEGGYRFIAENRVDGSNPSFHMGRVAIDAEHKLQELLTGKLMTEFLPNFTQSDDIMLNGEVSLIVRLSAIFSLKWGYQVKFRNVPAVAGLKKFDTALTGALLAKF